MDEQAKEDELTLRLLQAVDERSDVTQRRLSQRLGVALGLTNSYLRRCMRKGLIKIREAPSNRYLYYLTPKGFSEKSRLTASYLATSFDFYRNASGACRDVLDVCNSNGWHRIVLCGMSELCEIAVVRAHETNVELLGIYEPRSVRDSFLGILVYSDWDSIPRADAYIVTDLVNADRITASVAQSIATDRLLAPDLMATRHRVAPSAYQ